MNRNMLKKALKWAGIALGSLVGVIVIILVVLYFVGGARVNKTYTIQVEPIDVPNGPTIAQIEDPEGNLVGLVQM